MRKIQEERDTIEIGEILKMTEEEQEDPFLQMAEQFKERQKAAAKKAAALEAAAAAKEKKK